MKKKKLLKIGFVVLLCLAIIGIVTVIGINNHVKNVGGRNIITPEEATKIDDIDCIVVLGCQVKDDGTLDGNDDMYIGTPDIGIDVKDN